MINYDIRNNRPGKSSREVDQLTPPDAERSMKVCPSGTARPQRLIADQSEPEWGPMSFFMKRFMERL